MNFPEAVFQGPFFIYSEAALEASAQGLKEFWSLWSRPGFELFYSVKANPNPFLLRTLIQFVDGFDVSSFSEAQLVRRTLPKAKMTWSGPAKTDRALQEIMALGLHCLHFDSQEEYLAALKVAPPTGLPRWSVRLATEGPVQKLGFSKIELQKLFQLNHSMPFPAVHAYLGRERFSVQALTNFQTQLQSHIEAGFFVDRPELFLGAGLPCEYILKNHHQKWTSDQTPQARIHLEAGRALTQSAGWYGTRVLAVKDSNVIIDGGLQHFATYLTSPTYGREGVEIQYFRDGKPLIDRSRTLSIRGSLSLWNDTLIEASLAPSDLRRGDYVVFNQMGAYGYTAGSNQFLGPTPVKEWLLKSDNTHMEISAPFLRAYQQVAL